ncbi:MAG: tRNA uridine-5-carboxymethylaminomethyl(34) synthesis enzyme MnmG [Verrucomicrobiae bacterium]|nr:tRNA uridine-5-carboxymethylaminomethyl(34) synthesis enzyme MnmG [Verrucomicrobiae bacterium]
MQAHPKKFDIIVVGAGHAGIEAALVAARMKCQALLITMDLDTIGKMSCNPAIGGLAKGHMVRELDALGGQMGLTTDMTGIQFRMLNRKKGPAVWAPRTQCDKKAYQFAMKAICERQSNLQLFQAQAVSLVVDGGKVVAVDTSLQVRFQTQTVILTTGTFLSAVLHVGSNTTDGGRGGEPSAHGLSASLRDLGFELRRLKTGTPPRLNQKTIRFDELQPQYGDTPPPPFSFIHETSYALNDAPLPDSTLGGTESARKLFHVEQSAVPTGNTWQPSLPQLPCHLTYTTDRTAKVIRDNLHRSPLYSGQIKGTGPRYCPSIEDKYVKFPDKATHQIFLEPEGGQTEEIYVNGSSTSLPFDVQIEIIHSIRGLEEAEIIRPGYAVEYDFAPPTQLHPTLETKPIQNLYFAGQLNGTTGYEEAAAQGFVAGLNAALRVQEKPSITFSRTQSYLGVLIDDLVTKGTDEPYRMFTSRAEFRLLLRQDNADERLTPLGKQWGLIDDDRFRRFENKCRRIAELTSFLQTHRHQGQTLDQWLRHPEIQVESLLPHILPTLGPIPDDIRATVEMNIKYEAYVKRDLLHVERMKKLDDQIIPAQFDYQSLRALRRESRDKLHAIRPHTIGQASRISGVTPADVAVLLVALKRG